MPKTELLQVIFDQPDEVFLPGQPISGRVVLTTKKKLSARAVNIKIVGLAHTSWKNYENSCKLSFHRIVSYRPHGVYYSANVKYLDYTQLLWTCGEGPKELNAGEYAWPFSYTLPLNIPPSFEGKYGYLRYTVKVEVDRPWRVDKAKKMCITVSPLLDLNVIPHSLTPINTQASENLGCCCFKNGFLEMNVNIPKTGFVPGETVPLNIHLINHSSSTAKKIEAKILQQCKFTGYKDGATYNYGGDENMSEKAQRIMFDTKTVVRESQKLVVAAKNEHKFVLELRIPSVTPTINQFSPVVTVEYLIQLKVDTSAMSHSEVRCETSILLGSVPIRQCLPPSYYQQDPSVLPSKPTPIGEGVAPPPGYGSLPMTDDSEKGTDAPYPLGLYPNVNDVNLPYPSVVQDGNAVIPSAPPPSYQESMYGKGGTVLDAKENEPYVPKYPVFNNLPVYNPTAPPPE
ncbi:Arrestin C-terminal-like domain-containing protein [Caenorhabditis elegans]|uniref:Arrestin C-terminal-like domain-containing protein n=1 Tax=Caenorhabditis elegans TaxID=6239 RepID=P91469_CAEEL|nr:Arrestin C-terminal-like domain-containing protein [Caenorhabditis elegans]CCD62936.1 Arrestin C-terminal-like domain-containing protein [Caenorhabditis elegans]|eukprot:NP_503955.1 ARRestin Domain protein [Caenorhabditis elegans]